VVVESMAVSRELAIEIPADLSSPLTALAANIIAIAKENFMLMAWPSGLVVKGVGCLK
jgi:hypothetical protein